MNLSKEYVAEYTFREKETQDLLDETIFIIFAEIARFDKRQDECVSVQERMLYVLKHSQDIKKPTGWLTEGIYARLLHAFEVAKFMKGKLIRYIRDMMDERKRVSEMNTYERRGRAEGKVQERLANARKMKELGMDIALICQVTGLSEQQVLEL
jgi:predicted transposase/invertase (TIGR01784 family)